MCRELAFPESHPAKRLVDRREMDRLARILHPREQDFAATLARLEGLVTRLEAGDMSLEASLGAFEGTPLQVTAAYSSIPGAGSRW